MIIPAKTGCLGTGSGVTEVTRKWECLIQHGNCRHSLRVHSKLTEWGMKLPARPACLTPLLVVLGIKHSHIEVLTYSPGLTISFCRLFYWNQLDHVFFPLQKIFYSHLRIFSYCFFFFFFFLRERKGKREASIGCLPHAPRPGTKPTCSLSVMGQCSKQLSHTSQGRPCFLLIKRLGFFWRDKTEATLQHTRSC